MDYFTTIWQSGVYIDIYGKNKYNRCAIEHLLFFGDNKYLIKYQIGRRRDKNFFAYQRAQDIYNNHITAFFTNRGFERYGHKYRSSLDLIMWELLFAKSD